MLKLFHSMQGLAAKYIGTTEQWDSSDYYSFLTKLHFNYKMFTLPQAWPSRCEYGTKEANKNWQEGGWWGEVYPTISGLVGQFEEFTVFTAKRMTVRWEEEVECNIHADSASGWVGFWAKSSHFWRKARILNVLNSTLNLCVHKPWTWTTRKNPCS